jgi:hypothetical protein
MLATLEAKLIAVVVLLLAAGGWGVYEHYHLVHEGEALYEAKVAKVTAAAEAKRTADLAKQRTADVAMNNVIEEMYEKALAKSAADNSDLSSRLRNYEAASRRGAAVPGDPATPAGPDAPAAEPGGDPAVIRSITAVANAAGHDAQQVIALQSYIKQECH